jgi:hypothetical protein
MVIQQRMRDRPRGKRRPRREHLRVVRRLTKDIREREHAHAWLPACQEPRDARISTSDHAREQMY